MILLPAETQQEAKSHRQSLQEAIYQAQQSQQETRDGGQSQRKPNMTDSLCRKHELADSFIPCNLVVHEIVSVLCFSLFLVMA